MIRRSSMGCARLLGGVGDERIDVRGDVLEEVAEGVVVGPVLDDCQGRCRTRRLGLFQGLVQPHDQFGFSRIGGQPPAG